MKYCSKCGNELMDEAVFCPKCGCAVNGAAINVDLQQEQSTPHESTMSTLAKVFMIISVVISGFELIFSAFMGSVSFPLLFYYSSYDDEMAGATALIVILVLITLASFFAHLIMTIVYFKKLKRGEPIGTAFKVCSLIFVSLVAGILMLCDKDNP